MASLTQRAREQGTPLIEGEIVTFLWQGQEPPALRGDFNDWDIAKAPAWRKTRANLWRIDMAFPAGAYIEYCFGPDKARVPDPYNARVTANGIGDYNHFFYTPPGGPTPLAVRQRGVPRGALTRHRVATEGLAMGDARNIFLYQPPTAQPAPLVVVWDGPDYLRRAQLPVIVENLTAAGRMQPVALAMVANGGKQGRVAEYACSESTLLFLLEKVLPLARQHLNLVDPARQSGSFGVMGASMGGLMALYTALRLPQLFGRVLSQSGAFAFGAHQSVVFDLIGHGPQLPLHIWMDVGRYEWLMGCNRDTFALLYARGYDATYREFAAGHNYPAWRDDLWRGLVALFPPAES